MSPWEKQIQMYVLKGFPSSGYKNAAPHVLMSVFMSNLNCLSMISSVLPAILVSSYFCSNDPYTINPFTQVFLYIHSAFLHIRYIHRERQARTCNSSRLAPVPAPLSSDLSLNERLASSCLSDVSDLACDRTTQQKDFEYS